MLVSSIPVKREKNTTEKGKIFQAQKSKRRALNWLLFGHKQE
jgi:hypothetical protein